MKITLDISDNVVCAFLNGVRFTATGAEMFSHQLDGDDLIDGNTIKLPREVKEDRRYTPEEIDFDYGAEDD